MHSGRNGTFQTIRLLFRRSLHMHQSVSIATDRWFFLVEHLSEYGFDPKPHSLYVVYAPPVNWKWLGRFDWFICRLDKDKIRKIIFCHKNQLTEIEKMGKSSKSGSETDGPTMSDSMSTSKLNSQTQRYWRKVWPNIKRVFSVSFVQFRNHKQHPALERQMSDVSWVTLYES